MTDRKLSDAEALELWRRAEQRLRLVDTEPPVAIAKVDALLQMLGPRRQGEALGDWLERGRTRAAAPAERPSAEIIPFSPQVQPQAPALHRGRRDRAPGRRQRRRRASLCRAASSRPPTAAFASRSRARARSW